MELVQGTAFNLTASCAAVAVTAPSPRPRTLPRVAGVSGWCPLSRGCAVLVERPGARLSSPCLQMRGLQVCVGPGWSGSIDSSFIDVFTDEEPSGPRGPATGQPPKTRLGATPENKAQLPLPVVAAPLEPQPTRPGDTGSPAGPRPKTRSLGPVPSEADGAGLAGQQRRGKRFKLFRKELDTVSTAKRPGRGSRASRLRPRRKGRAEPALSRPRDLRTQAPKSHADPGGQALLVETRSSRRLRLSPGQDCRRRRPRGGTWSKELIHKIDPGLSTALEGSPELRELNSDFGLPLDFFCHITQMT